MELIRPLKQDHELLDDVHRWSQEHDHLHLWWLGQSGFLLMYRGQKILLDPYLSDSLTEKYAATDKPHLRMSARVINPELLTGISAVTSSHQHTDHLDAQTLLPLRAGNKDLVMIIPEAIRALAAERLDGPSTWPVGLDAGEKYEVGVFTFYAVPAAHNTLEKDEAGKHKYLGYVIKMGPWTVYHSGDTLWYEGMTALLKPWRINIALLPINGDIPERRVAGNLNCREAAGLAHAIDAEVVIPCHYDMFKFNTANPKEFAYEAARIGQKFKVLRQGEHYSTLELMGPA